MRSSALVILAAFVEFFVCTCLELNPVEKTIQLLADLEARISKEKQDAWKVYTDYTQFFEKRKQEVEFEVKQQLRERERQTADIEETSALIADANQAIQETAEKLAKKEVELKDAEKVREVDHAAFLRSERELMDMIDALERAIPLLTNEDDGHKASMIQVQNLNPLMDALNLLVEASVMHSEDATRMNALIQDGDEDDNSSFDFGAPSAAAYKISSKKIVAVLEDLNEKAREQLGNARKKDQTETGHNNVLLKSYSSAVDNFKEEIAKAQMDKTTYAGRIADAQSDLTMAEKAFKNVKAELDELVSVHKIKYQDAMAARKRRIEDLEVLAKAKQVLIDGTSGATSTVYGGAIFLQEDTTNVEVFHFLKKLAVEQHSARLKQLIGQLSVVMRSPITELLDKLVAEASQEAVKNAWCSKETSKTKRKNTDIEDKIANQETRLDLTRATLTKVNADISNLQEALKTSLAAEQKEDQLRQDEKAVYMHTANDLRQGIEQVQTALRILREYFNADGDSGQDQAQGASAGILGLLEVVESDFTRTLAEVESSEQVAKAEYNKFKQATTIERTAKEVEVKFKIKKRKSQNKIKTELNTDLEGVHDELDASSEYLAKLAEQCQAKVDTYSERKAHRDAEIEGLKEALATLKDGQSVMIQSDIQFHQQRSALRGSDIFTKEA